MKRIAVVVVLMGLTGSAAAAEEKPAKSRIASVGLFKNGLAVVQRTLTVDGPGVYRVEDVPEPIHGTFWVESDAKVTTRLTRRVVEVPARQAGGGNFQEELAGREVVIHFNEQGIPPVSGTVMEMDRPRGEDAWNRAYQQPSYDYYTILFRRAGGRRRPDVGADQRDRPLLRRSREDRLSPGQGGGQDRQATQAGDAVHRRRREGKDRHDLDQLPGQGNGLGPELSRGHLRPEDLGAAAGGGRQERAGADRGRPGQSDFRLSQRSVRQRHLAAVARNDLDQFLPAAQPAISAEAIQS